MKSLRKNNLLIIILFVITILMSVGFAVLSTTLNINGTAKVKSQTWDIHFENVNITEGSVTAIKEANIANDKATLVEYEIELSKPGDFYEFTVDAVNEGTLDSMIEMVTLSGIEGNEDYVSYQATYLSGEEIKIGDALNASTSETYKIRIEYKKDIENLPSEDIKVSLVFGVTYSQSKDGEVITNYYTLTGTAYGVDGLPLTDGEIEVHSKVVTAPINSDGTFILKNIPVGKHEIYIKDTTGNVINEGEFTLQTGDKTTIENNIVTANSNGNIELNIEITEETVILKNKLEVSYKCKRATTLHTEECKQTSTSSYCSGAGYTANGSKGTTTITYGNLGTKGTLTSGDAFDSDVNGDGTYDEETERFYYVSDLYNTTDQEFNSDYAVLIYYNNTILGESNPASAKYAENDINYKGPISAIINLPTITQWSNVNLSNSVRAIITETGENSTSGGALPTSFSYEGYSARLLTSQEVGLACGINVGSKIDGELDKCNYLMENTRYSSSSMETYGPWLETPLKSSSKNVWRIISLNRYLNDSNTSNGNYGVRPAIEVLKTEIEI